MATCLSISWKTWSLLIGVWPDVKQGLCQYRAWTVVQCWFVVFLLTQCWCDSIYIKVQSLLLLSHIMPIDCLAKQHKHFEMWHPVLAGRLSTSINTPYLLYCVIIIGHSGKFYKSISRTDWLQDWIIIMIFRHLIYWIKNKQIMLLFIWPILKWSPRKNNYITITHYKSTYTGTLIFFNIAQS